MSGETPLGESHRAGIMQFQTKITGIEKRLIAKGIEDSAERTIPPRKLFSSFFQELKLKTRHQRILK
eukprot:scaffold2027_cov284-Chaetoceros_neogracile.AAC.1